MIEPKHPQLPIVRQCELLGLARASYYHRPEPETDENLRLMRVIDETYLAYPVFGSRQMARWLRRQGYPVNRKRVRRLMLLMGLEAIYQKPNTSRKHPYNPVFRYLLRRMKVERPNLSVGIPKPSTDGHVKTGHAGDSRQMRREGLADKVFVGRGGVEERGRAATRKCGGGLRPLSSTSLGVRVCPVLGFVL